MADPLREFGRHAVDFRAEFRKKSADFLREEILFFVRPYAIEETMLQLLGLASDNP